jgi:hypothetical protein
MNRILQIISTSVGLVFLYLIHNYVNAIDKECECTEVDHTFTKYINSFVYVLTIFAILSLFCSETCAKEHILKLSSVGKTLLGSAYLIYLLVLLGSFIYLINYVYKIHNKCKCHQIKPTQRTVVMVYLWFVLILYVFILLAGLLVGGVFIKVKQDSKFINNNSVKSNSVKSKSVKSKSVKSKSVKSKSVKSKTK